MKNQNSRQKKMCYFLLRTYVLTSDLKSTLAKNCKAIGIDEQMLLWYYLHEILFLETSIDFTLLVYLNQLHERHFSVVMNLIFFKSLDLRSKLLFFTLTLKHKKKVFLRCTLSLCLKWYSSNKSYNTIFHSILFLG